MLGKVAGKSEKACHDVLRGNYEETIAEVIAGLNGVLNDARRVRAEGPGDPAPEECEVTVESNLMADPDLQNTYPSKIPSAKNVLSEY